MKKSLFRISGIAILFVLSIFTLHAQTWPPAGMNGNGSCTSPWEITTVDQLATLAKFVNAGNGDSTAGKYYILMNDIDLAGWEETPGDTCGWKPIGIIIGLFDHSKCFQGNFNGNTRIIRNLIINRPMENDIGLFGGIFRGNIQNLGIEGFNIKGKSRVGALAGYCKQDSVHNCYVTGRLNAKNDIGSLMGRAEYSRITNCYAKGYILGERYVGGLMGTNISAILHNCIAAHDSIISTQDRFVYRLSASTGSIDPLLYNYASRGIITIASGNLVTLPDDHRLNGISKNPDTLKTFEFYTSPEFWHSDFPWDIDTVGLKTWNICNYTSLPYFSSRQNVVCENVIIISAGTSGYGTIIPSGFIEVIEGEDQTFTFIPVAGEHHFYIDSVFIDGIYDADAVSSGSYTFYDITDNHSIHVIFATQSHTITAAANDNGSLTPLGNMLVHPSENQRFIFRADPGFRVDSLLVDGVNIVDSIVGGSYTFYSVTENHTLKVVFKMDVCGGDGTEIDPYQICTVGQLVSLAEYVNTGNGKTLDKYYKLMNDIDLTGWEESPGADKGWKPIGWRRDYVNQNTFSGCFDGNGNVIKNLNINRQGEDNIGFFGALRNATIKNLGVKDCNVKGRTNVGGMVGYSLGNVKIINCYVTGNINGSSYYAGGLIGYNESSVISDSYAIVNVTGRHMVGGIAGINTFSSTIANCYTKGKIYGNYSVGGILGYNNSSALYNSVAMTDTVVATRSSVNRVMASKFPSFENANNYALTKMVVIENGIIKTDADQDIDLYGISKSLDTLKALEFYTAGNFWRNGIPWDIDTINGKTWKLCDHASFPFLAWEEDLNCPRYNIITAATGNNGSIVPSGFVALDNGEVQTFTFIPQDKFYVDSVFIDGVYNTDAVTNGFYTFHNITENHTIHVTFATNALSINGSADINGYLSPSGLIYVDSFNRQQFTFNAAPGFTVDSLLIDGIHISDSIAVGSYTFQNVRENHTIRVTFKLDFCGGEGTATNPYQICDVRQLASFAAYVNAGNGDFTEGKYYILMDDLDLTGWESMPGDSVGWDPIGNCNDNSISTRFQGHFDGRGHIVRNLTINRPMQTYVGLFGYTNADTIQNLGLEDYNIKGGDFVGAIVGLSSSPTSIKNCYTHGIIQGNEKVGGIAGCNHGFIANSYAIANITGNEWVGGLVGANQLNAHVTNCYITGKVSGNNYIGGITGDKDDYAQVSNCVVALDTIIAWTNTNNVNRIIGMERNGLFIKNNYAYKDMVILINNVKMNRADDQGINGLSSELFTLKSLEFYETGSYWNLGRGWDTEHTWWICDSVTFPFLRWLPVTECPYRIVATAGNNGSISPSGFIIAENGENQVFHFFPDDRYYVDSVYVDGIYDAAAVVNGYFTFTNLAGNHNIHVTFATDDHTVTAFTDAGGIIIPSGAVLVPTTGSQTFMFNADPGFIVDSLLIDGINIPDSIAGGSYTFNNITEAHTIEVTFKLNFCGGDGTEANPYQICTSGQLASLAAYVNAEIGNSTGKYFILMNDIDLAGWQQTSGDMRGWKPIGSIFSFEGDFNGNHKVVRNLTIDRPEESRVGLFGFVYKGSIYDLGIENCFVRGYSNVGGLMGFSYRDVSIRNCYVKGNISGRGSSVGGLAGTYEHNSNIINSYVIGNVSGSGPVGGLIGQASHNVLINDSYANCVVNGSGSVLGVGGLVGDNDNSSIINSYSTGMVTGNESAGGISGCNHDNSVILNCYSTSFVNGNYYVGGLVGRDYNGTVIQNSVAANAAVHTGRNTEYINRIIGYSDFSQMPNTYHHNYAFSGMVIDHSGVVLVRPDDDSVNGISKSLDTLRSLEFYMSENYWYESVWDIDSVSGKTWKICDLQTLPYFPWQENIICNPYTITATAGGGGTISPSGRVQVNEGENQTFTFASEDLNITLAVFVDGLQIPVPENFTYTFQNVRENHTIHVDFTIKADDHDPARTLVLYPNPAKDQVVLRISDSYRNNGFIPEIADVKLYDVFGRLLNIVPVDRSTTLINVSHLSSGIYFLHVNTTHGTVTKKFVKE